MSYEIVYDREFIKTTDGRIIPLVLSGSNNCWETGLGSRWRRERHWCLWLIQENESPAVTAESLMERVRQCIPSTYQQHFIRNGKWADDAAFFRFFENGIKKAKTLEDLNKELSWPEILEGYIFYFDENLEQQMIYSSHIKNSDELDNFLKEVDERLQKNSDVEKIYARLKFLSNNLLERPRKPRKKPEHLEENYYVITTNHGYVSKLTRTGLYSTWSYSYAKQFASAEQARKWIRDRDLERRFRKLTFGIEYVA